MGVESQQTNNFKDEILLQQVHVYQVIQVLPQLQMYLDLTNEQKQLSKEFLRKRCSKLKYKSSSYIWKVIISTPIKRDDKKALSFVHDVIKQLPQVNTETIINVSIEENMLGKKGLHPNRNGLKEFAKNLKDAIRKFRKLEKPFCHLAQNDTNKLIENKISSNLPITSIEDNNILHNFNYVNSNLNIYTKSEKLETQSKQINPKDSNFDLHELGNFEKTMKAVLISGYLKISNLSSKIDYLREICR